MHNRFAKQARRAFTLIEILIVVVILGILAAIVIPQFTNASDDANASAAASLEQTVRGQLELYRVQHGIYPAELDDLWDGSTTDADGNVQYYLPEQPSDVTGWTATYDPDNVPVYNVDPTEEEE